MFLALFLSLLAVSRANHDLPSQFRRYALHGAVVLGNRMYIEGGEISTGVRTSERGSDYKSVAAMRMPALNRIVLWADENNGSLYRFGGSGSHGKLMGDIDNRHLWAYQPGSNGDWHASDPANPHVFNKLAYSVNGVTTFCDDVGLIAGGFGTAATDSSLKGTGDRSQTEIPGMLTYNASTAVWANVSAAALSPSGARQGGQAVCSTSFETPLAVFVGGLNAPSVATQRTIDLEDADMTNIHLYDVRSNRWFSQRTTGDAPKVADAFCSIGVESKLQPNLTVYDIVVFGGHDSSNNTYGDIHILSIPSFQWTKVDLNSDRRIHHSCVLAGKSQMIVSGGITYEWDWSSGDSWKNGLGVLDLNKMSWSAKFDANATEYTSPEPVEQWYTAGRMKTMKWDSEELKGILKAANYENVIPPARPGESHSKKTPVGAVVGGVVGGIAIVAIVGGLLFFFRRRQQRAKQSAGQGYSGTGSPVQSEKGGVSESGSTPSYEADSLPQFEADSLPTHEADSLPKFEAASTPKYLMPSELGYHPEL